MNFREKILYLFNFMKSFRNKNNLNPAKISMLSKKKKKVFYLCQVEKIIQRNKKQNMLPIKQSLEQCERSFYKAKTES